MTTVKLFRHPFRPDPPQVFEADSLARWLLDRYEGKPPVQFAVYAGEPATETEVGYDGILRGESPVYTVLESPGTGFEIAPFLVSFAISTVLNVVLNRFFAEDQALDNRTQESPNNALSNRENRVRVLERVEDIYGTVRSIPTILMQTYSKYIGHRRVEYGYYCITRGYADVSDVRDGDTLLSEISGASAAVYAPFTSPNSGTAQLQIGDAIIDDVLSVSRSNSVELLVLKPTNQIQLTSGLICGFFGPGTGLSGFGVPASSDDVLWQPEASRRPNFAAVCEVGQEITITMVNTVVDRAHTASITVTAADKTYTSPTAGFFRGVIDGTNVTVAGSFVNGDNVGVKTVVSHTDTSLTVAETLQDESGVISGLEFTVTVNYSGVRTISEVGNAYVALAGPSLISPIDYPAGSPGLPTSATTLADLVVDNDLTDWTDWFTLPQTDRTEVWTNVLARSGMYKDDGAKSEATVEYELQIEQLDSSLVPTGVVETVSGSITGATSTERAETLEQVTAWTGPARVRARRTTPFDYDFSGFVNDEITWVDLYSVSPVDKLHFGNKTTIHTVTRSTIDATSVRRRELNCLAARKLPTYNGTVFSGTFDADGALATGTISATSKIVDIIAAVAADPQIGNVDVDTEVDMAQLWTTQQALDAWNSECGQFNYTFDSDTISFEETVRAISNAGFCTPYRQNGKIRLALDRPQSSSVALFTHRNKKPDAETITRRFVSDSDYDGVELVYVDPETEKQETIRLPLAGGYTRLKKVEVPGIRSYEQAWFRANREYYRLLNERLSIETVTTTDARALLPNSRVDIVDNTRFKSYDGEVIAQDGLTLTLSREVAFAPAAPHSILLMKRDGSLQSITCTEVVGSANKVLLAGAPAEAIVTTPTAADGIRTIFSFAADSARGSMAWLVRELSSVDGQYVRIRAVNYSDDYYTADSLAVPAKEGVIYD